MGIMEEGNNLKFSHSFEYKVPQPTRTYHYDIMVENLGRHKFGGVGERKGIHSDIKVDEKVVQNFTIYSLDFEKDWVLGLKDGWHKFDQQQQQQQRWQAPAMYRTHLNVPGEPQDTYLSLPGWTKGQVFVNGFNLGRYWEVGPQKTLYVPAPLLNKGDNTFEVFELHKPGHALEFVDRPNLG